MYLKLYFVMEVQAILDLKDKEKKHNYVKSPLN
jgi:hypothetical protein